MKTFASALLLALFAAAAHASDPLGRALETRDWASGTTKCESLAADEARRPDRPQLSAAQYAEKAAQCAAIASGAGDQADATWWWFTAVAMDTQRALELLPSLRERGLLLELPPPRSLVGSAAGKSEAGEVLLPNGDLVKGELAKPAKRPEWPKHMFRPVTAVVATEVVVEVLIDTDGRPTQPVLASAKALPIHAFVTFDALRDWRFTPARVNGEAVVSVYSLTVNTSSTTSFPGRR